MVERSFLLGAMLLVSGCDGGLGGSGGGDTTGGTGGPCCDTGGNGNGSGNGSGASTTGATSAGAGPSGSSGTGGSQLPCGDPPTFDSGIAPTQELHVATSGDDGGDGSAASPFRTIGHAIDRAAPGTSILVHPGTYPGDVDLSGLAGSDGAPIWLGGAPGEARPILQGGQNGLRMSRVRYVVVHDLEIEGGSANGVNCDDGGEVASEDATRWIVFRNIAIRDIGTGGNNDCLKLSGVNDFWVLGSTFTGCGGDSGSGIDHVGCHRGVVARNTFENLSGNGVQTKGGSADILVWGNHFDQAGQRAINIGGSTGFEFFRPPLSNGEPNAEARRIHVVANLVEGGENAMSFVGCVDCLAANNTIVDPGRWPFRILQETSSAQGYEFLPASNGRVINNVVWFSAGTVSVAVNVGGGTDPESFVFASNLWYAHDDPGASTPALPVAEQGGVVGSDPAFVGGGDYHLTAGSPAAGAGTAVPELTGDRDGACYASPPSLGAFELAP